jgi:transcriptional regulator with XRE-family HTH domain
MAQQRKTKQARTQKIGIQGDRVRKARLQKGWTQYQLCMAGGFHASHISMIENGRRDLTGASIKVIASVLGCSSDYLLGLSDSLVLRK